VYLGVKTVPYTPHTTQSSGRYCLSCHLNLKVIGSLPSDKYIIYNLINERSEPLSLPIKSKLQKKTHLFKIKFSHWIRKKIIK
jgi:hypothetical protein